MPKLLRIEEKMYQLTAYVSSHFCRQLSSIEGKQSFQPCKHFRITCNIKAPGGYTKP